MRSKDPVIKQRIVDFIGEYYITNGKSPSLAVIADAIGRCKSGVYKYLVAMNEEGLLKYDGKSIETPKTAKCHNEYSRTAIVGSVPCGLPSDEEEYVEEYVSLPTSIFGSGELYILRASGNSMIDAGIDDGDLVVIKKQAVANDGDIIVALVNNRNTLKRFFRDEKHQKFILHPENKEMEDIIVEECLVQGVAVNVIKQL